MNYNYSQLSYPHLFKIQHIRRIRVKSFDIFIDESQHLIIEQYHDGSFCHHKTVHLTINLCSLMNIVAGQTFLIKSIEFLVGVMSVVWTLWCEVRCSEK